ncbi:MAG: alanine racemase [Trueperella sp.]|nr:alanine racemase [Trueperella sp.]
MNSSGLYPSRALISKSAFLHNLGALDAATASGMMPIVKANGYGHGRDIVTDWLLDAGVQWLGVAQIAEAQTLADRLEREGRLGEANILCWIYAPGSPFAQAIKSGIHISLGAPWAIAEVAAAAREAGVPAKVHIKVDTAMARGGFSMNQLADAVAQIAPLQAEGVFEVVGLWSHLARADEPECPLTAHQVELFEAARQITAPLHPQVLHLAASSGMLWHENTHYDLVRPGIALYGVSPNPEYRTALQMGLRAVMQLEADLIVVRDVPAGTGVSYGHTYVTEQPEHFAVVPIGYADGVLRSGSNRVKVWINGELCPSRGRICMDQFVVSAPGAHEGDLAVLFGDEAEGYLTANDWAAACGTVGYEVFTALGPRVHRIAVP